MDNKDKRWIPSRHVKVRYRDEINGNKNKTVYLDRVSDITFLGHPAITGDRVDKSGEALSSDVEIHQIIQKELIVKISKMEVDKFYGDYREAKIRRVL